jgi:FkbM family methyltransferase
MLKRLINGVARMAGVRVVNAGWGPAGFVHSLRKMAAHGWIPQQIIDVGAWKGTWTVECMGLFPEARYLLIDPLPTNRDALVKLGTRCPNVLVWHGAAGSESGQVGIHCHEDQSSALAANVEEWRGTQTIMAPMRTLDSFLETGEIKPPQLLKADVQGFELEVLRGATAVLQSLDAALIEVSFQELYAGQPFAHHIVTHMADAGFRIFDICTYAQGPDDVLVQSDFLFVRRDWPAPREHRNG